MQAQRAASWSQVSRAQSGTQRIPQSPLAAGQLTQLFAHPTLSFCQRSRTLSDLFLISLFSSFFLLIALPHVTLEKKSAQFSGNFLRLVR